MEWMDSIKEKATETAAAAAGLGALTVYCRRAQEQRDRIEEKLDELLNKKGDAK